MPASLEKMSFEVFELVVVFLELSDIRNLRGTSRTIAAKACQRRYLSFLRWKRVELTEPGLRAFVEATKQNGPGCLMENLILAGIAVDTASMRRWIHQTGSRSTTNPEVNPYTIYTRETRAQKIAELTRNLELLQQLEADSERFKESADDVRLLSEAFRNIKTYAKLGKLRSLTIRVIICRYAPDVKLRPIMAYPSSPAWKTAIEAYRLTMRSLSASELSIDHLNLLNEDNLHLCCDELANRDSQETMADSLASLKSLSIGLCGHSFHMGENLMDTRQLTRLELTRDIAHEEVKYIGIANVLRFASQLDELHVDYCDVFDKRDTDPAYPSERLLHLAARLTKLPSLKKCRLSRLRVNEPDLLDFIKRTSVQNLTLSNVTMVSGSFVPVFAYCTSDEARLEELHCENLKELDGGDDWLHFDRHGVPAQVFHDPLKLDRIGVEIKQPISTSYGRGGVTTVVTLQGGKIVFYMRP